MDGLPDSVTSPSTRSGLASLVTAIRWGSTTLGLLWSTLLNPGTSAIVAGAILVGFSILATVRPLGYDRRGWQGLAAVAIELSLTVGAVGVTGGWESPFIFTIFTPVIAAGFERGFRSSLATAAVGATGVAVVAALSDQPMGLRLITTWMAALALVAILASYGRSLIDKADRAVAINKAHLQKLNHANALLISLNRVSGEMTSGYSMTEAIDEATQQLSAQLNPDSLTILVHDDAADVYTVASASNSRMVGDYTVAHLPNPAVRALNTKKPIIETTQSGTVTCVPLLLASSLVGVALIDFKTELDSENQSVLADWADQLAVTIDNIRWFERLQAKGAAQERLRLARDLHDGLGQSVAHVAFELDRLCVQSQSPDPELQALRDNARAIVSDLRETLYDLRTDVDKDRSLVDVINEFAHRLEQRSKIPVTFEHHVIERLPLAHEREVWRIAQEAMVNATRHSRATHIEVTLRISDRTGTLTVSDNGTGISGATTASNSHGITGMRERAGIIGGRLEIRPGEESGTLVQLLIGSNSPGGSAALSSTHGESEF